MTLKDCYQNRCHINTKIGSRDVLHLKAGGSRSRAKLITFVFSGEVLPPPLPLFRGGGRGAQDGDDGQEEHSSRQEDHHVLCDLLNSRS